MIWRKLIYRVVKVDCVTYLIAWTSQVLAFQMSIKKCEVLVISQWFKPTSDVRPYKLYTTVCSHHIFSPKYCQCLKVREVPYLIINIIAVVIIINCVLSQEENVISYLDNIYRSNRLYLLDPIRDLQLSQYQELVDLHDEDVSNIIWSNNMIFQVALHGGRTLRSTTFFSLSNLVQQILLRTSLTVDFFGKP